MPSLTELRAAAGQPTGSPELALGQLVWSGRLPLEADCVVCSRLTDHVAKYHVVCERPTLARGEVPWWQWPILFVHPVVLLGYILRRAAEPTVMHGRDVSFTLPMRVCDGCMPTLTTRDAVRDALRRTPDYARLLDKYPAAGIRNAD